MKIDCPAYFTIDRETFTIIFSSLPFAMASKLLGAMIVFFSTGTMDYKLPREAQMMFDMVKPSLVKKRKAALNKMRNQLYRDVEEISISFSPCTDDES